MLKLYHMHTRKYFYGIYGTQAYAHGSHTLTFAYP